jgi:hypothetical protein
MLSMASKSITCSAWLVTRDIFSVSSAEIFETWLLSVENASAVFCSMRIDVYTYMHSDV